ncbi:MAG: hypothetical protein RLZZ488_1760 [Pseudomonadota bacterium]|jgi:hypothetical protein
MKSSADSIVGTEQLRLNRGGFTCLLSLAFLLASCDMEEKKEAAPDLSKFSGLYSSYLSGCKECHEPNNVTYKEQVLNLDMSSEETAYTSLTSTANIARWASLGCDPVKYVNASSSSGSILYAILDAETADAFGNGACKPLKHTRSNGGEANDPSAEQKQAIKAWIDKGAPRN